jgi:alpha-galactosidase
MVLGAAMLAAGTLVGAQAQKANVASTPPMGWNSWDAYGLTITEDQFRANVKVERDKLLPFGWKYAVIDEGWFFENPKDRDTPEKLHYAIDKYGRYVPVPARFPTAGKVKAVVSVEGMKLPATLEETSFAALGAWVHEQGLKFGIHIVRGIPRASVERNLPVQGSSFHAQDVADQTDACGWDPTNWGVKDNAAGQAWYDSLLRQYAAWGVDLLKVDCISDHPYKVDEIRMIRKAIDKTGRPMVLSLSPGPTSLSHAVEVGELSNMWRISNDVWDLWAPAGRQNDGFPQNVRAQFGLIAAWEPYAKPGNWPDADMLPLGELKPSPGWGAPRTSRLTLEEERTLVTLWSIGRSPLILGANLTLLDDATLRLLTNKEVIAVNQTATKSEKVWDEGGLIGWRAELPEGKVALAFFNTSDTPIKVDRGLVEFGDALGQKEWEVKDVWADKELGFKKNLVIELAPHASELLVLR